MPDVIYQDNHLLILNKPAAMPVVPDSSRDFSLLDWGRAYIKKSKGKPGNVFLAVVHRIDRPVSGLVCFARTSKAASRLSAQMRERNIIKEYFAVSCCSPGKDSGRMENFMSKDRRRNVSAIVEQGHPGAKLAVTDWSVLQRSGPYCLFRLRPVTGRPHQLRVHMASLNCPIFGDIKYASRDRFLQGRGIALHSGRLVLLHPTRQEIMDFKASLPGLFPFSLFDIQKSNS